MAIYLTNKLKSIGVQYVSIQILSSRSCGTSALCNTNALSKFLNAFYKDLQQQTNVNGLCASFGQAKGDNVLIPRIRKIQNNLPNNLKRLLFLLKVSFSMTINKS